MNRRDLLRNAGCVLALSAAGPALLACSGHETRTLGARESKTLAHMARLLFPYDALKEATYAATPALVSLPGGPKAALALLRKGLADLDAAASGRWLEQPQAEQLEALRRIQSSAFFQAMKIAAAAAVYRDQAVWKQIGYQGSSVEYGGYLERGFDDIDWLPGKKGR